MLVTFIEGNKIGVYQNGRTTYLESDYLKRYAGSREENKKVKKQYYAAAEKKKDVKSFLHCVIPLKDGKRCLYSASIDDGEKMTSILMYKDLQTGAEELFYTATGGEYKALYEVVKDEFLVASQGWNRPYSCIARLKKTEGVVTPECLFDEKSYTDDPILYNGDLWFTEFKLSFDNDRNKLYFQNGRVLHQVESGKKKVKYNYYAVNVVGQSGYDDRVKGLYDRNGALYYIRRDYEDSVKKKGKGVPTVLKILGFPKYIFLAIKKSKDRKKDWEEYIRSKNGLFVEKGKTLWLFNQAFDVKKVESKNKKYDDLGYVPAEWALVKLVNGTEKVLAYGVADYDIIDENGKPAVVYTNGKRVYKLTDREFDVERAELFEAEKCVRLAAR